MLSGGTPLVLHGDANRQVDPCASPVFGPWPSCRRCVTSVDLSAESTRATELMRVLVDLPWAVCPSATLAHRLCGAAVTPSSADTLAQSGGEPAIRPDGEEEARRGNGLRTLSGRISSHPFRKELRDRSCKLCVPIPPSAQPKDTVRAREGSPDPQPATSPAGFPQPRLPHRSWWYRRDCFLL